MIRKRSPLPDGDLVVVARNRIGGYFVARVDAEGSFVWMRESETTVVTTDSDPNPLVAGAFDVTAGTWDPKSELWFFGGAHRTEDNDFLPYRMAMNAPERAEILPHRSPSVPLLSD